MTVDFNGCPDLHARPPLFSYSRDKCDAPLWLY